ncbi:hypothetical protein ACW9H6_04845, partial [Pseudomonas sp. SDO528_S397]
MNFINHATRKIGVHPTCYGVGWQPHHGPIARLGSLKTTGKKKVLHGLPGKSFLIFMKKNS